MDNLEDCGSPEEVTVHPAARSAAQQDEEVKQARLTGS